MLAIVISSIAGSVSPTPEGGDAHAAPIQLHLHGLQLTAGFEVTRRGAARVTALRHTISDRRSATWRHQDYLRLAHTKTAYRERRSSSVPYLRWMRKLWNGRAHRHWKLTLITLRDFEVYPDSHAWLKAVREVQKVHPNTAAWLLSCSASEGGWGRRVYNSQGSGAAFWLQFMPSTFAAFSWRAVVDAARRGFIVPATARRLESPLGQALAGAWAYRNGLKYHWAGAGCR